MTTFLSGAMLVLTPVLAFIGAVAGHWLSRRSARELDVWRRREETMRVLRWAAGLAVADGQAANLGVTALKALSSSEMLQKPDQELINACFEAVIDPVVDEYNETTGGGDHD